MNEEHRIREEFERRHGEPPTVVVRAPGRVNLIGEHTDYSGLPVLPIAIEQALYIAAAPASDGAITAASLLFEGEVTVDRSDPRHASGPSWGRYLAGVAQELTDAAPGQGARLLIGGDLPAGGGLSSSSALSVGVMGALNALWSAGLALDDIAARAARAERHVGVETGGMDQAVITFAEAGHALRIDFMPPAHRLVPIPAGLTFVAAYSGEEAPKGGAARDAYNERVVGARIAAVLLADAIGVDLDNPPSLGQVADTDVVDILVEELPEKTSAHSAAHGGGVEVAHITNLTATIVDPKANLLVKRVARHILSEAARVDAAEAALGASGLEAFGRLLDESHNSLREDFRCSTPALDRLCAAMRKAGALGARLTGAGFGGYAIAGVAPARVQQVIDAAIEATGGPAMEVRASDGMRVLT